jgi:hypothetical protein
MMEQYLMMEKKKQVMLMKRKQMESMKYPVKKKKMDH